MRHVPPPLWALLLLGATYLLSEAPGLNGFPMYQAQTLGVIIVAVAVLLWAILQFRFAKTQLLPNSETNNALVTNGIFSITRNPMYLAMTLFCFGGAVWFGRPIMLLAPAAMFAVANWVFIPFEEEKMRRQFGDAFDAYCTRVRRWI